MKTIQASYIIHRNQKRIRLQFENYDFINNLVKNMPGARWSKTYKSWHVPCDKKLYSNFKKSLPDGWIVTEIKKTATSIIEQEKKAVPPLIKSTIKPAPAKLNPAADNKIHSSAVSLANHHALQQYLQCLQLKAYSASTIKTYRTEFFALLQILKSKNVSTLNADDIKRYMLYCLETLKLSENSLHSRINALKFYYEQVLGREKFFWEIPRPKKHLILPKVLGEDELKRLFTALQNKKHKAILFTAYSAGLRVSEVVNLKLIHIDRSRMQIFIESAKGKKDRYVMLSPVLLDILTNYYKTSKVRPATYIFEGPVPGTCYSTKSMQKIFQVARQKAGIHKTLTFHSLRHSFATHLLEKGVDIKYIKELLGHFDIRTTERYLHVKKEQLVNICSPLDDLLLGEEIM